MVNSICILLQQTLNHGSMPKGQLVISKVPWGTFMKMKAEYLPSTKPSNPTNAKLVWPVEGMSKSKKAEWYEKFKAYEFKNGVLYYHHSVKDRQELVKVSMKLA